MFCYLHSFIQDKKKMPPHTKKIDQKSTQKYAGQFITLEAVIFMSKITGKL